MDLYALLCNSQKGDEEATKELFLDFYPAIKNLSKKISYEEAETDLTISFLEFIKRIDIGKFFYKDKKEIAKFINVFLKNKSVDLFRKHVLRQEELVEINYDLLKDPSNGDFISNIFVSELIEKLPLRQRQVIVKKFIFEFSDIEIANQLQISRQAVNSIKRRALNRLKKILADEGGECGGRKDHRVSWTKWDMDSFNSSSHILYSQKSREKRSSSRGERNQVPRYYI
jgi:RNA polymerase sigma factor (sigma-70 family)